MRLVGYARVSTVDQATCGHSLEAQQRQLAAFVAACGHELLRVEVDDGLSAKNLRRPALQRALAALDAGEADGLLVAHLDRLTRSLRDLLAVLDRLGIGGAKAPRGGRRKARRAPAALLSVAESLDTSTPSGRMHLHLLGAAAQWQRESISERTREVAASRRAQGFRVGSVPYGFQLAADGKRLEPCQREQEARQRARELRAGGSSLREIGRALLATRFVPRGGGAWNPKTIASLLRDPPTLGAAEAR